MLFTILFYYYKWTFLAYKVFGTLPLFFKIDFYKFFEQAFCHIFEPVFTVQNFRRPEVPSRRWITSVPVTKKNIGQDILTVDAWQSLPESLEQRRNGVLTLWYKTSTVSNSPGVASKRSSFSDIFNCVRRTMASTILPLDSMKHSDNFVSLES